MAEFVGEIVGVIGVVLASGLLYYLYFVLLPQRAIKKYAEADPERLRRYLERVVVTPSLVGSPLKVVARIALVEIYRARREYAEAAAHCRSCLDSLPRFRGSKSLHALEGDIRRRYADCLESLGWIDEATHERSLATDATARAPADPECHLTQGILLERENRHAEAYAAFQKALELTPRSNTEIRIKCLLHLVLSAFKTGRPLDCLRFADEAIALGAKGVLIRTAHRMAGVACGSLGRLEESELHFRHAYDAAAAENSTPDMAEILANGLASCLHKRGRLVEANEACIKAAAMHPKGLRMALAVQSEILRTWGRFEEALAVKAHYRDADGFVIPALERNIRAVCFLDTARIEAQCGKANDAWNHIQEARAELAADPKLGFKCDAALAWVIAARGLADESRHLASMLEPKLADFECDPSICRGVLHDLGMAAWTRGDYDEGITCWTHYLALGPDPVYHPTAHYHRGECHRHLGRLVQARNDYRAAVAMNLDTFHTKLAREWLAETALRNERDPIETHES